MSTRSVAAAPASELIVLSYHDVGIKRQDLLDEFGVTVDQLAAHFAWLRHHGYAVVGIDDVLMAQRGERRLPDRAVLLTFDDGLASFHTHAFPLLQLFNYPALVAVVGSWHQEPGPWPLLYGKHQLNRAYFLSNPQLRALAASPLIEFASHSFDLHRGLAANAAQQMQPAAVVRVWDAISKTRETQAEYTVRLRADLSRSIAQIQKITGRAPRVMVWPFGEYTGVSAQIAKSLGLVLNMSLTGGLNRFPAPLGRVHRFLISTRTTPGAFAALFAPRAPAPVRMLTVRLDSLLNVPSAQIEKQLDQLIERVDRLGATHVFIPALSRNGERAVFQTDHLRSEDLLNRVAWQLRTRAGAKVYARWPIDLNHTQPERIARLNRAFADMLDTVPLAGVVFDFEDAIVDAPRVREMMQKVLETHPDDHVLFGVSAESAPKVQEHMKSASVSGPLPAALVVRVAMDAAASVVSRAATASTIANGWEVPQWTEIVLPAKTPEISAQLNQTMRALQRARQLNFGWAEDDFINDMPASALVAPAFSARTEMK